MSKLNSKLLSQAVDDIVSFTAGKTVAINGNDLRVQSTTVIRPDLFKNYNPQNDNVSVARSSCRRSSRPNRKICA
ncbi:unnamed protein product [Peronospora farinosa]|uniref:Uncharacterized protein n=1 Tax=Peronospora farinosa TaxID=134698 RepID=A0AAV0U889_9STRA|nr:unnamed protein product [Peronospora farinosa]